MADAEGPASVIIVKRRCSAPVLSPPAGALVLGAKVEPCLRGLGLPQGVRVTSGVGGCLRGLGLPQGFGRRGLVALVLGYLWGLVALVLGAKFEPYPRGLE